MIKWFIRLRTECTRLFAAFLYFFITFNLINFTEGLRLEKEGIIPLGFWPIFIAALLMAKVILIADHFPFINLFPHRPLIYNILWKTQVYGLGILTVRLLDRWIPFYLNHPSFSEATIAFIEKMNWPAFTAIQIWYFFLFFLFVFYGELSTLIGSDRLLKVLFKNRNAL